jgi:hypothetical protein
MDGKQKKERLPCGGIRDRRIADYIFVFQEIVLDIMIISSNMQYECTLDEGVRP